MKKFIFLFMILLTSGSLCACEKHDMASDRQFVERKEEIKSTEEVKSENEEVAEQWDKGYNLPIDDQEREEAEYDCIRVMGLISNVYDCADKGDAFNVVLSQETLHEMQDQITKKGYSVIAMETYSNMENYERVDNFLQECLQGKSGSVVVYELHFDGGIGREKYIFDGKDMYFLYSNAKWNMDATPGMSYISYTRINKWNYSDKGWFGYELCVPEPPEVTEVVDGSCLLRIKPMPQRQREMSEICLCGLEYKGNNLLCSNWDAEHMENLDYNGMYEYLYAMKYQEPFQPENYPNGIPKEEFESLIMEYLPITAEQIQKYAAYDEEYHAYLWARIGCGNYSPTSFGTAFPEVTDIKNNEDGTVTLTVDAVCDMIICNDAVITHELTVRFAEDGSFQYLGNEILYDGIMDIPEYQYRIPRIDY